MHRQVELGVTASRLVVIGAVAGFGLVACGGSEPPALGNDSSQPIAAGADTVSVSTLDSPTTTAVVVGQASADVAVTAPGDEAVPPSDSSQYSGLQPEPNEYGQCHVDVAGAVTASWDAGGGTSATLVDYWMSDDERAVLGPDVFGLIINCAGDPGSMGFISGSTASRETVPLGPGTYELPAASAGINAPAPIRGWIDIADSEAIWGLSQPGVLEITVFDTAHVAGNFSFVTTDVLGDVSGELQVSGSFDFANPGG